MCWARVPGVWTPLAAIRVGTKRECKATGCSDVGTMHLCNDAGQGGKATGCSGVGARHRCDDAGQGGKATGCSDVGARHRCDGAG